MARVEAMFTSHTGMNSRESWYEAIRTTGQGTTPFFDALNRSVVFDGTGKDGHAWFYREAQRTGVDNAWAEGACAVPPSSYPSTKLANQLQIFRKKTAMSDTEIETAKRKGGDRAIVNKFEEQQLINRDALRLDIERALLSADAPVVAATSTDVRKMAGVKHYVPANAVFDLAGAPLDPIKHISLALRKMSEMGIMRQRIVIQCGGDTFEDVNAYYQDKKLYEGNNNAHIEQYVQRISTAYAKNVEVEGNNNLEVNEIIVFVPDLINPVIHRSKKGVDASTPGCDFKAEEDIFELSLQVLDPYACIHIKNAGRMA